LRGKLMSEFTCTCKCYVTVEADDEEKAEELAIMCLEEGEGECIVEDCTCDCEK